MPTFDPAKAAEVRSRLEVDQKRRKTTKAPTDADFAKLVTDSRLEVEALVAQLAEGTIEPDAFILGLYDILFKGHTGSVVMGRHLAGDFAEIEADDEAFAALVMEGESQYLANFLYDLQTGRYHSDGDLLTAQVSNRARSYTGAYRATANEVFKLASPEDAEFDWYQLTAEPCEDCPKREAGSPYKASELTFVPGDMNQACGRNCGCVIVRRSDGVFGFSRSYD